MGKAARIRRERAIAVAPPGRRPLATDRLRLTWLASAGVVVVVALTAGVLLAVRSPAKTPPAAAPSAADRNAPASLVNAANAVGFHPTTEPGVGQLETQPASAAQQPSNPDLLPVGSTAPLFSLKTPQGQSVSLESYRGKTVLLEFFATWCPHCNAEAPYLRRIAESLPAERFAVASVNADGEDAPSVFAYHRYYGFSFPALLDPSSQPASFNRPGAAGPVTTSYRVQSFPTFYVIAPNGKIAWRSDGEQPTALLRQELRNAAGPR